MSMDCRAAAARCLSSVIQGKSLARQLPAYQQQTAAKDQALLSQLCYGSLRLYPKLHAICKQLLRHPLKSKDQDIHMLLLLGGYQLMETRIPDHAAVDATVNACVALKKPWAKKLVNGVLRQWQRKQNELIQKLPPDALLAHPAWLYQAIKQAWPEQAPAIFQANNEHPPQCLRVNQLKISREDYLQKLTAAGLKGTKTEYAPSGIRLEQPVSVEELPGFFEGLVSIQDESAQLAASLMSLEPGMLVLDACAAPGGKTCHMLEIQPGLGRLVALDKDPERLTRIQENLGRLNLTACTMSGDASVPQQWWDDKLFDRILLDAPCSATGVIRRNPDIKVLRTAEQITSLARQQFKLLSTLWPCLKPNGRLVYATCSVLPEENEKVVQAFLDSTPEAEHQLIDSDWGTACSVGRQLLTDPAGPDGFYYATLAKKQ
jgi:16S rRNA (cytosine967-C5)-methyltransferase